jgi:phosphonopyruvate decarboxylase
MISAAEFITWVREHGLREFFGVPDSLLRALSSELEAPHDLAKPGSHVIMANEGAAVGAAVGSYLASGRPALVYMQNSGLGNAVNPLVSTADAEVYSVPMILVIGWRGMPGEHDEPQHLKQGRVTPGLLELLDIPWRLLPKDVKLARDTLADLVEVSITQRRPVALLVAKGTFAAEPNVASKPTTETLWTREAALEAVIKLAGHKRLVVATTGMLGRELYEIRQKSNQENLDFLNIGSMGHAISIALGATVADTGSEVVCLDGDGSIAMHLGSLAVVGKEKPARLLHIVFNNRVHDSVGGQPTAVSELDLAMVAESLGYSSAMTATATEDVQRFFTETASKPGPHFLQILVRSGSRSDLGRPLESPYEMLSQLRKALGSGS